MSCLVQALWWDVLALMTALEPCLDMPFLFPLVFVFYEKARLRQVNTRGGIIMGGAETREFRTWGSSGDLSVLMTLSLSVPLFPYLCFCLYFSIFFYVAFLKCIFPLPMELKPVWGFGLVWLPHNRHHRWVFSILDPERESSGQPIGLELLNFFCHQSSLLGPEQVGPCGPKPGHLGVGSNRCVTRIQRICPGGEGRGKDMHQTWVMHSWLFSSEGMKHSCCTNGWTWGCRREPLILTSWCSGPSLELDFLTANI